MASLLGHLSRIPILHHLIILLILFQMPPYSSSNNDEYKNCTNLISCGNIRNIGFPFWGENRPKECGHPLMQLRCQNEISYINIKNVSYKILEANTDKRILRITRVDYLASLCPTEHVNTNLDTDLFVYGLDYKNITLSYGCGSSNSWPSPINKFPCYALSDYVYPHFGPDPGFCKESVFVPVPSSFFDISDSNEVQKAIVSGFVVRWIVGVEECDKCKTLGGVCGIDWLKNNQTTCYCQYEPCPNFSPDEKVASASEKGKYSLLEGKDSLLRIILIIIVPALATVMIFFICCYLLKRRSRLNHIQIPKFLVFSPKKNMKRLLKENFGIESATLEPLQFKLATLKAATNNFSDKNKIGKGGFGEVYKGILLDGRQITIKRLSKSSTQGIKEFKNEVLVIAKLQHRNLVTFIGFCVEEQNKILIYEYVSNKSLDYFLFDSQRSKLLSWYTRYNIIIGIARGILYLHELSRLKVIHRDLKPSNVLLDENMIPKISDFGLARIIEINRDHESTNRIVGTFGYMPPEYAMLGQFSEKSDVFSFGVMTLEIVTGKKNLSSYELLRTDGLLNYVWKQWRDQTLIGIQDQSMEEDYSRSEVIKCIQIGLLCVQHDPDARPTMETLVSYLSNSLVELPSPQEPPFFMHGRMNLTTFSQESSSNKFVNRCIPSSNNKMSISEFLPR